MAVWQDKPGPQESNMRTVGTLTLGLDLLLQASPFCMSWMPFWSHEPPPQACLHPPGLHACC